MEREQGHEFYQQIEDFDIWSHIAWNYTVMYSE